MDYNILSKNDKECFIEIVRDTFRNRIEFNYTPDDNFKGIVVCCNYSFKNHPVGFIKDNGLIRSNIMGYQKRPIFEINDTIIQAGPTLIRDSEAFMDYESENIDPRRILSGYHAHIGYKKSGNIIVGYTADYSLRMIVNRYLDLHAVDAIKLPGLKEGAFYFSSTVQTLKTGIYPIPAALVFESKLKKV